MNINLLTADPATVKASAELDALIAGPDWMNYGARLVRESVSSNLGVGYCDRCVVGNRQWSPSTNAAHAGEARRVADLWTLSLLRVGEHSRIVCGLSKDGVYGEGHCDLAEVYGDKKLAEALATCRAILAAVQAKHKQENEHGN